MNYPGNDNEMCPGSCNLRMIVEAKQKSKPSFHMNAIGNTPLLKLDRITEPGSADIFVKYEATNPTLSMKDRMALSMIEGAERKGLLKAGGTVIEFTGGSTGSSLAMVCAIKGYRA